MDYFQIVCGRCDRQVTTWPDRAERVTDEASAREYFRNIGWIVGKTVADCRCPRCAEIASKED